MKKFCEDEGYDYWEFCLLAREGQLEMESKSGTDKRPGFIEVNPDGTQSPATAEEPLKVCEIKIRFNNGLVLSRRFAGRKNEEYESRRTTQISRYDHC